MAAANARLAGRPLTFTELGEDGGPQIISAEPALWGDAVIVRKDVPASYHLAVVVDDAWQGVSHVTRGRDLYAATHLHRLLQVLLDLPEPLYRHHRLITDADGRKLAKSARDAGLRSLREAGATPADVRRLVGLSRPDLIQIMAGAACSGRSPLREVVGGGGRVGRLVGALAASRPNSNMAGQHTYAPRRTFCRRERGSAWAAARRVFWCASAIMLAGLAAASAGPREERGRSNLGAAESAKAPVTPPSEFARSLAAAARRQVSYFVFYNSSYQKIPYPMGDVPSYFGVCTDVVVRAYRTLGIDLQVQVQKAGVGTGDTNIDHRRVEVLRKFFARAGTSLPITKNPDDYKVGDIVTYYMPNGWLSKTHIAIVGAEKNLAGVPLVIHNRGWGVQAEDWLFAEKITGHFRYGGPR